MNRSDIVENTLVYDSDCEVSEDFWKDRLSEVRNMKCPEERDRIEGWFCETQSRPLRRRRRLSSIESPEQKFVRLATTWKAQRGHHSDTLTLVMHPAYQSIIAMGTVAIPFILRELALRPDRWYWALRAITEQDPVSEEDRGNSKAMAEAWLEWGKMQGYQW